MKSLFFRARLFAFAVSCVVLVALAAPMRAQIQVNPPFPTDNDTVTVTFDATQGTGGLTGVSPVFAHTGVITHRSLSPSDWKFVVAQWGTDNPKVRMTPLGNNLHSLTFHIRSYYGVPATDTIKQMAFVFRNANGTQEGKAAGGADIYYPVYAVGEFVARILSPAGGSAFYQVGDTLRIRAASSLNATLVLLDGQTELARATNGKELTHNYVVPASAVGAGKTLRFQAMQGGQTRSDSLTFFVRGVPAVVALPEGIQDGITTVNDSTVILTLFAPNKQFIYVVGDFNDWQPSATGLMNRTPDGNRYWIRLTGLTPRREYGFQYIVDGSIRTTDPYVEKILDPFNDPEVIRENRYPNLQPPYPTGKTTGMVGVFQTPRPEYRWRVNNFRRPAAKDIVAYELLIRDFTNRRTFRAALDSLQYLKRLGVNCIELMPIMEFDGNLSWGYNPAFFCAVDKYYGTEDHLREFIDSAHALGMSVVLDMVLNHATGSCPLYQLYSAAENPYFNVVARHPFNVFNDFNHEFAGTQLFVDRVLRFWIERYRFDGYRFDLSKGFTQLNSGNNVGLWSARDTSRIRLLKRMYDVVRTYDQSAYMILEHFADNSEETELANYGFMLWGNMTHAYNEATMGWNANSNFSGISYRQRGWQFPHLFGYMESHDEERLMYKNIQFGNRLGDYSTRDTATALERMKMAAAFFFTVPGPKMIWQFGEIGYDYSINWPSFTERDRLTIKPARWDYYDEPRRRALFNVYAELIKLKLQQPAFSTENFTLSLGGALKRIHLNDASNPVTIIGNFDVQPQAITPNFQSGGAWHEFFTRRTLDVADVNAPIMLRPGEFRLYSKTPFPAPPTGLLTSTRDDEPAASSALGFSAAYPNPASDAAEIRFILSKAERVSVKIYDARGAEMTTVADRAMSAGEQRVVWTAENSSGAPAPAGVYFYRIFIGSSPAGGGKIVLVR